MDTVAVYKKTDEHSPEPRPLQSNPIARVLQFFWFAYMIYNWCGNRGWIPKHDHGDIGEGMRLSQYWVMYATVSTRTQNMFLTGILNETKLDLFHYLQTGTNVEQVPTDTIIQDMSRRYPSPRWERALSQWAQTDDTRRARHFCQALCQWVNDDRKREQLTPLTAIEMTFQHLYVLPPGSTKRYSQKQVKDSNILEYCVDGAKIPRKKKVHRIEHVQGRQAP
jgi:hypothetical protein